MGIVLWIVFGALVGWVASVIMKSSNGVIMDIVIGIIGAIVGGWLMSFFGNTGITDFNFYSFLVALLGAVVLIAIARSFRTV